MVTQAEHDAINAVDRDVRLAVYPRLDQIAAVVAVARREIKRNRNLTAALAALDGLGGLKKNPDILKKFGATRGNALDAAKVAAGIYALETAVNILNQLFDEKDDGE